MLKRRPLLTAVVVALVGLGLYYALISVIGPQYAEVCSYTEKGEPYGCRDWDRVTAFAFNSLGLLDRHNGIVAALSGVAVAFFTAVLWRSTDKLWLEAKSQRREARRATYANIVAAKAARRSAKVAERALTVLERAYPYVVIKGSDVEQAIQNSSTGSSSFPKEARASVDFTIKNYGKTPATLLNITANVFAMRPEPRARDIKEDFVPYETRLIGGGETDEAFTATMTDDLDATDFFGIYNGECRLLFSGWVHYRDIWDETHTQTFSWAYNPTTKRWVPTERQRD